MKLKSLIGIFALLVFLSSCLKNTDRLGFLSDKGSIISEIATVNELGGDPYFAAVSTVPAVETIDVLKVAFHNAKSVASGDIKIKLVLDPSIISDYNTANAANLVQMPFTSFTLSDPTLEITLPKGTYGEHMLQMSVTKAALSLTTTYALGFKIQSVSEGVISDLANNMLFIIGVKNIYDGVYSLKGYILRAGDPVLTGNFSGLQYGLVTAGANSCDYSTLQVWGDGQSGVGIGIPRVTVDPATNNVTMSSPGGAHNMPGYPNRYVPATKTFYIGFTWGGGPGVRECYDTMTYLHAR
jgi:Domain of unknown function (DUF1735)